jgi:CubicO group peptidase (beta-lactamase class C family)
MSKLATLVSSAILLALMLGSMVHADGRTDQVDALFKDWDPTSSPGCALGIIQDGSFLYKRGYGMANLDYDIPITSTTVFRIGSVSKQFAAMALVLAAEEGKLSLDDKVRKYISELPEYPTAPTIRHLLYHTSGIRDYVGLMDLAGKREEDYYSKQEAVEVIARQRNLNFTPGDEYLYSNSGYFLLSQIILRATGQTLRQWADERMFRPLGMENTHFHDDLRMVVPKRATGYRSTKDGGFEIDVSVVDMVGDGSIFTTVEDLLKWDQNFDDNQLGGHSVMEQMLTPGKLNGGEKQDYAFGLSVSRYRGLPTVGHGGSWVGYRAAMLRFPEQKFSVFCLCNRADAEPEELATKIADIYLADQLEPVTVPKSVAIPDAVLQERVGTYWNDRAAEFGDVEEKDGQLTLPFGRRPYRLLFEDHERFLAVRGSTRVVGRFEKGVDGAIRMHLQYEGQRPFEYELVHPVSPTPSELESYEGIYFCEDLDATYRLQLTEAGKLAVVGVEIDDPYLEPVFQDGFRWERGSVVFERDSERKVSGFRLSIGQARNFRFVRNRGQIPK